MAWTRPTRDELRASIEADLASSLPSPVAFLSRGVLRAVAGVTAGAADILYGILGYIVRQPFVSTCDDAYVPVHGAEFGVSQLPALPSTGTITITGTSGTDAPAGTVLTRASDGWRYEINTTATVGGGGSVVAAITAIDLGADGDLDVGETLQFASLISGIDSEADVATALSGGRDLETLAAWRARILERKRRPPQGGAAYDYVAWALEGGAAKAWVVNVGGGAITLYFVVDGTGSGILPDAGEITAVETAIENADVNGLSTRRPVTHNVTVSAPTEVATAVTGTLVPNTSATRAAADAAIEALMLQYAGQSIPLSAFWLAVGSATGVTSFTITSPSAAVTVATGETATYDGGTWS